MSDYLLKYHNHQDIRVEADRFEVHYDPVAKHHDVRFFGPDEGQPPQPEVEVARFNLQFISFFAIEEKITELAESP